MKKNIMMTVLVLCLTLPLAGFAMDYQHRLEAKDIIFSWTLEGDLIHVQLSAKTEGWVGIGFDPEDAMAGANIIIGAVKDGQVKIEDHFGDRKRGHSSDEELGGKNDVQNPAGTEDKGMTTISFTYPLNSGNKYDKPVPADGTGKIMLAYGAGKDSFKNRHAYHVLYEVNFKTGESKKIK
ncbi:MAG: DOMON domain-containing protein [Desulfobacterales bacterium RIFOXYA12_FULL_46_15]|nr:MAG: DOMON domain-containing protein [Desulfobacterales bacterium RIFOXYA12_FULL_46_15]